MLDAAPVGSLPLKHWGLNFVCLGSLSKSMGVCKGLASRGPFQCLDQKRIFGSHQRVNLATKVADDEEDAV
jgi:hypothetical protein